MKVAEFLGLLGVEAPFAFGFDREPRIGFELRLDRVEPVSVGETKNER
jgi:hypothetical protein